MPVTRAAAREADKSPRTKSASQSGGKRKGSREGSPASEPRSKSSKKNGPHATKDVEFEKGHRDDAQECRKNERSDIHASGGNGSTIQKSTQLGSEMPSNVVEKGVIYFLARSRVDLEDPHAVADLQRSYIVLRPLPKNAKLGDGPIPEGKASRLIALPKKTLPRNRRDRFMAFVEKSKTSTKVLKETFFQGEEYETQSKGTRHTQPVTPVGEGVYAITTTGRTSHLVYILAIPSEPGQVQNDLGIHDRGSFVLSLKNPTIGGPSWATLSEKPNFPKSIQDDFRGLRWMPIQKSEYLDYPNSQLLLIGEAQGNLGGGAAPAEEDQKNGDKMTPEEELNRLEEEEEARIEHLHGDDSIFDDLHIDKTDYPHVLSTW